MSNDDYEILSSTKCPICKAGKNPGYLSCIVCEMDYGLNLKNHIELAKKREIIEKEEKEIQKTI